MLLWIFSFLLFFSVLGHAKPKAKLASIACEKRYVIATMNSPPSYFVEKGKKTGVGYDILTEVVRRLNCKYTDMIGSNSALIASFGRSSIDLFGPLLASAQLTGAEFIQTWKLPRYLVVRKDYDLGTEAEVKQYLDNPKIVFGNLISGQFFLSDQELRDLFAGKRLKEYPFPEDLAKALQEGKIQALFAGPFVLYHYIIKTGRAEQYKIIEDKASPLVDTGFYMSTKRLSVEERQRVREVFNEMHNDGTLFKIVRKYLDPKSYRYFTSNEWEKRLSSHIYRGSNSSRYSSSDSREF